MASADDVLAKLNTRAARVEYRCVVRRAAGVSDAMFRVLDALLERADANLDNSFPSRRWLLEHVGGRSVNRRNPDHQTEQRGMSWLQGQLRRLEAGGWIRRVPILVRLPSGRLAHGTGTQFLVPDRVLPGGWEGPATFSGARRRPKGEVA